MTELPFTLNSEGKLTRDIIQSVHDLMAQFLHDDDILLIVCSLDVCLSPSEIDGIEDIEVKVLMANHIFEGLGLDYQHGTIASTVFGHEIQIICSRPLPPKTCYVSKVDKNPVPTYKHYPYSSKFGIDTLTMPNAAHEFPKIIE